MTSCPPKNNHELKIADSGNTVLLEPIVLIAGIAKIAKPAAIDAWHKAGMEFRNSIKMTTDEIESCEKDRKLENGTEMLDQNSEV